jgi:hypothetical protein
VLTESEVWSLMAERCNRAEIASACQCDETVAKALMVKAAMSRGIDERNPRRLMHLDRTAGQLAASPQIPRCNSQD